MTGYRTSALTYSLSVELSLSFIPALDALAEALGIRRNHGKLPDCQLLDIGLMLLERQKALSLPSGQNAEEALARAGAKEGAK